MTLLKVSEIQNLMKLIAIYTGGVCALLRYREEQNTGKVGNVCQVFDSHTCIFFLKCLSLPISVQGAEFYLENLVYIIPLFPHHIPPKILTTSK